MVGQGPGGVADGARWRAVFGGRSFDGSRKGCSRASRMEAAAVAGSPWPAAPVRTRLGIPAGSGGRRGASSVLLVTARPRRGNLPAEFSSFVDRRAELSEVRRLLGTTRLVTLTGVGGVGKTRLGLRAAAAVGRQFADGVWLVELAGLRDAVAVAARGVRRARHRRPVRPRPGRGAGRLSCPAANCCCSWTTVSNWCRAVAALVRQLLRAAPGLRVLATSREMLQVPGEAICLVAPPSGP